MYTSGMIITFREYKNEDRALLLEFIRNLGDFVKSIDPLKRIQNNSGFFELDLNDTLEKIEKYQGKIYFAESKKKISGYIAGVIWEQSEKNKLEIGQHKLGEVIDLIVKEELRGQGVGTALLKKMENYFKEKDCDSMWVSVFAPNENAHNLYKKFGFINREIGMLKQI